MIDYDALAERNEIAQIREGALHRARIIVEFPDRFSPESVTWATKLVDEYDREVAR